MGTPEIAKHCLEAMIRDEHFEVVGVVTQPDRPAGRKMHLQASPVKELVRPLGIPILTPENVNEPEVLAEIEALGAEVVVVVAFGQILKNKFLEMFPQRVVNLHASVLPRWRGAAPIQRAIMTGDLETGVSLQLVVRKLDAGPVLGFRRFQLTPEMNAFDSYKLCMEVGTQLISVDLMDYLRGNLSAVPQDEAQVTYAAKIEKSESEIDWKNSAEHIHNQVRGLAMGPVAQTQIRGKALKVHRTHVHSSSAAGKPPGQILPSPAKSMLVQCGAGSLELLDVQPESRSRMPIEEYLRGHSVQVGESLGKQSSNETTV
jgi:methionyl-tRNA formyltransferase